MARKAKPDIGNRSKLVDALSFVSVADTGKDADKFAYVTISDGYARAANDVFAIGTPVEVELELCLHGAKLKAALEHCGQNFQLTQLDGSSVSVKSEKFRATIPCIDAKLLPAYDPDPPCGTMTDSVKNCFSLLHKLITEKTDRVIDHGLHLRANTGIATNGGLLFEYFHGHDLPPDLVIPKATVLVVSKIKQQITTFGFSKNSITFWFADSSYLRSKLLIDKYPQTDRLFRVGDGSGAVPLPVEFFTGLDAIDKFAENDSVYFSKSHVTTHPSLQIGASYKVDGLPDGHCFSLLYWKQLRDLATMIIWAPDLLKPVEFYGKNLRGLIVGKNG
jgi:hypothetical protein